MKGRLALDVSFLLPMLLLFLRSHPGDVLLFFLAVLLHEIGHLLALAHYGALPKHLRLSLTGASLEIEDPYLSYKKEAMVFLAGPLAGLLGCAGTVLWLRWQFHRSGMLFFSFNLLLTLFNLLPIRSLDGGGALYALLCRIGEEETAERISRWVHFAALAVLLLFSIRILQTEKNPALLILSLTLLADDRRKRKKATITS